MNQTESNNVPFILQERDKNSDWLPSFVFSPFVEGLESPADGGIDLILSKVFLPFYGDCEEEKQGRARGRKVTEFLIRRPPKGGACTQKACAGVSTTGGGLSPWFSFLPDCRT
jgi:hypothetical protein